MQKNTKILLGLGLIGLAYYLWQRSSKQDVNSNIQTDRDTNKMGEKRAKELSNEYCEIMSKAYSQGRELNQEEETRANQIGKQVEQLGYTGVGFSIISGVPNCNQLITIEESNKYPRF